MREWCYQTMNLMKRSYESLHIDHQRFEGYLRELREHRAWERRNLGRSTIGIATKGTWLMQVGKAKERT